MISFRPYTVLLTALTLPILVIGCGKKTDVAQIDVQSSDIAPIVDIGSDANSYADPAATVVEVNGKKMTEGECNAQIDRVMISQGMHQLPDEQRSQARTALRQNVIDSFIAITVLTREADARKVTVSDEDINGAIESIKAKIPPGANFQDLLSHQGFSESDLREQIATDMKITKLIEMQCVGIPDPSNEEIRSFYEAEKESFTTEETVHARHVLIATTEKDNETTRNEKKALAEKCRKELLEGADFQDIAKKYSDCPSKTTGGDLGAFQRGSMVPPFETAAFSQKINEIGPIVETRFGYHIVQVLSHTEPGTQSLDAVKDRIIEFLTDQKKRDVVHTYIDVLRDKATISYGSET